MHKLTHLILILYFCSGYYIYDNYLEERAQVKLIRAHSIYDLKIWCLELAGGNCVEKQKFSYN
jgi:hypothetical protein